MNSTSSSDASDRHIARKRPRIISKRGAIKHYIKFPSPVDNSVLFPVIPGSKVWIALQDDTIGGVIKTFNQKTNTILLKQPIRFMPRIPIGEDVRVSLDEILYIFQYNDADINEEEHNEIRQLIIAQRQLNNTINRNKRKNLTYRNENKKTPYSSNAALNYIQKFNKQAEAKWRKKNIIARMNDRREKINQPTTSLQSLQPSSNNDVVCNDNNDAVADASIGFSGPSFEFDHIRAQEILNLIQDLVYLSEFNLSYYNAIEILKSQRIISLLTEPDKCGRHSQISLLTIGTRNKIYIFDRLSMDKILDDLKNILEDEKIKKITYFSPHIYDQLSQIHGIRLCGLFDIFTAYSIYSKPTEQPLDLVSIIQKIMGVPYAYFTSGEHSYHTMNTYQRPLPQSIRTIVAKKVAFQFQLFDYFLHDCLLEKFYKGCDQFSKRYQKLNRLDAASTMSEDFGLYGIKN